jgi:colanic acid biosynthesis glycosyl transferase WcaI
MLDMIWRKGVPDKITSLFPNWVDSSVIYPMQENVSLRDKWEIGRDQIVVLYSGNMGEKQGLEILVETAKVLVHDKRLLFILSGDGASRKQLEDSASGLENIRFVPLQPAEHLNELLNTADIHVLPQRPDVATLVMPSKLIGMLASGRPVVATVDHGSELAGIVSKCGMVTAPGNIKALTDALLRLTDDADLRCRLGAMARSICIERWDRDEVLTCFESDLAELMGGYVNA